MIVTARSVVGRDVCYRLQTEREDYSSRDGLHWAIYQYSTFGDGDTQHSPAIRLCDYTTWADALVSLATGLIKLDDDGAGKLQRSAALPDELQTDWIQWAATIRYDAEKVRYYSTQERKVSIAESHRHDKRWERVPEWADGSATSVARIFRQEYETPLEFMLRLNQVTAILENHGALTRWVAEVYTKHPDPTQEDCALADAVRIYAHALRAVREHYSVQRGLECWRHNYGPKECVKEGA